MGGERERAELAAFEDLLSRCIAEALVAQVRKGAVGARGYGPMRDAIVRHVKQLVNELRARTNQNGA